MTFAAATNELTRDSFLGGAVEALQPARGHHRAGLEAVLLASALPRSFAGLVVDLGAGAGIAGMCAVARDPARSAVLVERDPELVAARARSAGTPRQPRLRRPRARRRSRHRGAPRRPAHADAVLMNPPFYAPGRADAGRAPGARGGACPRRRRPAPLVRRGRCMPERRSASSSPSGAPRTSRQCFPPPIVLATSPSCRLRRDPALSRIACSFAVN